MLISKLIKISNMLDSKGFYGLANDLDGLIKEALSNTYLRLLFAMSREKALQILGLMPDASPDEINKAFKTKALEFHPDLHPGKNTEEQMKEVNVARDILLNERPPSIERPSQPQYSPEPKYQGREPDTTKISWEEAAQKANVPGGVEWKFKTATQHSSYLGDTSAFGFVVYGLSETSHVFVGVYHSKIQNAFTHDDVDIYKMKTVGVPKEANLADIAPGIIRSLWADFEHVKGYNAKIIILKPGMEFSHKISFGGGDSVSFKDGMALMGNVPITYESGNKIGIILQLGYGKALGDYSITFIVNGRSYKLSDESSLLMSKKSNLLKIVFGTYYYEDSKKLLTRLPVEKRKKIFEYLATKLEGKEPEELIKAFKLAAEQAK